MSGYFHAAAPITPTPTPATPTPPPRRTGLLTNPPKLPPEGVPVGRNLIVDPSMEETPTGELPKGWFAWLDDLEVIAYDCEKLPSNFGAAHGKNIRMK